MNRKQNLKVALSIYSQLLKEAFEAYDLEMIQEYEAEMRRVYNLLQEEA
jgi:hypothetical protein